MAGYIGNQAQIRSGLSATIDELNIIDGVTATTAELNYNDTGAAVGTVVASKTVTADANKDVASLRNVTATGVATVGSVVVADGGNIGAASDTDSLAIASNGVVTFSQAPVFPDGSLNLADLDIDGGTDIGAALVDADLMIVDDGAGGTNRKATMDRLATYMATKIGGGTEFISSTDISNAGTFAFTGFDDSKYDVYKLFFSNLTPANDNTNFQMVSSSNGGSSYDTSANSYTIANLYSQSGYIAGAGSLAGYAYMPVTGSMGTASGEEGGASIEITIFGPHLAQYTHFQTRAYYVSNGSQPAHQKGGHNRVSAADVDAVRFAFSSGNIASGTFTAYGMVNS